MAFVRTSALSNVALRLNKTGLTCCVPRNYTAVVGTSNCFVLNLTTACRELLQKSLFTT